VEKKRNDTKLKIYKVMAAFIW